MGDVLTLVEKAQKEVELADVEQMQKKLQEATFDFSDFVKQMRLIKRMGSLGGLMKMIPGMNKIDDGMLKQGEQQLKRIEAMISSMTQQEWKTPTCWQVNPQDVGGSPAAAVISRQMWTRCWLTFRKCVGSCSR